MPEFYWLVVENWKEAEEEQVNDQEFQEQKAFTEWVRWNEARIPQLKLAFHPPNGGLRSKAAAGKLKAIGTRPGVPDYWFPVGNGRFKGMVLEFKSAKGSLSLDQRAFIDGLRDANWFVEIVRTASEAITMTERFYGHLQSHRKVYNVATVG